MRSVYVLDEVAVHSNLLHASRDEARGLARGELSLAVCEACGFIQNSAFRPELIDYRLGYEDAQGHSSRFRAFANELVARLVDEHGLHGARILEIGCGQGDFLRALCERAGAHGIGFDPVYRGPGTIDAGAGRVEFRNAFYGAGDAEVDPDFVFLRHTLEHVDQVRSFVEVLAGNLRPGVPIYVEVPETRRILEERAFWDVYYEHPSYFTDVSLTSLLERHGFSVERCVAEYDGQYLAVDARVGPHDGDRGSAVDGASVSAVVEAAEAFGRDVGSSLAVWRQRLDEWRSSDAPVVLWGAGSKAVAFLDAVAAEDEVAAVVDINPTKQGAFQAGTGHRICAPEELKSIRPEVVIVMNPIYRREIEADLADLGLDPELEAL